MPAIHVGIIGAGAIARDHAKSLKLNRNAGRLSFFDLDAARAKALADEFEGDAIADMDALCEAVDLVWVCTPQFAHRDPVLAACRAKKAVFCEKPLAHSVADARAIRQAVTKAGVPFYMGHSGRYAAVFQKMKQLVDAGDVGQPIKVWSNRQGFLPRGATAPWRLDDAKSGGPILETGVHEIDFVRWLGGDWESAAAYAAADVVKQGKTSSEYQHSVVATGTLASGAIGVVDFSFSNPHYVWQRGVVGSDASLLFDDSRFPEVLVDRPGKKPRVIKTKDWIYPKTGENMTFREQDAAVLKAMKTGEPFGVSIDDGYAGVATAAAIRKAAATGRRVKV